MKTAKFFFAALACLFVSTTVCSAHDYPVPPTQLPAAAHSFLQQHFPGKTIVYAEKDTEFMKTKFEVNLNDGTQVDFDSRGNWDKVDGHDMIAVPAALVPAPIQQYVNATCAGATVTKVDKERYGYDVELSNGMEMKFIIKKAKTFSGRSNRWNSGASHRACPDLLSADEGRHEDSPSAG